MTLRERRARVLFYIVAFIIITLSIFLSGCQNPVKSEPYAYSITRLELDSCQYWLSPGGSIVHKANCPHKIHAAMTRHSIDTSLWLFQNADSINDIVGQVEKLANRKCETYHVSFGISKNRAGTTLYSSTMVVKTRAGKNGQVLIDQAASPKELFMQIIGYLETL